MIYEYLWRSFTETGSIYDYIVLKEEENMQAGEERDGNEEKTTVIKAFQIGRR